MVDDKISVWIAKLQEGDKRAPEAIWQQYFENLVRLARRRLGDIPRRVVDEEDVALSALSSVLRGAVAGRFPNLTDRDDLWKILVTVTARKAMKVQRRHFADKRGAGKVHGESIFDHEAGDSRTGAGIDQILGKEPTPELTQQISDSCNEMISILQDETLETIAIFKLEGYTNEEIAQKLECATRTVERKLERIRQKWLDDGRLNS